MKKKSSFKDMGGLLSGALARHNIGARVVASQIVGEAKEMLHELIPPEMHPDIIPTSFKDGTLTLACRHPAAMYAAQGISDALARRLEEAFPSMTVRGVECRLRDGTAFEVL